MGVAITYCVANDSVGVVNSNMWVWLLTDYGMISCKPPATIFVGSKKGILKTGSSSGRSSIGHTTLHAEIWS